MSEIIIEKNNPESPTKIAVLCCDGANHFYLLEQLSQHFSIAAVVMETDENQLKWLWKKKRYSLWFSRLYHQKRRQLMGHSAHRKRFFPKSFNLAESNIPTYYPFNINERGVSKFLKTIEPDITIVCGTMFVGKRTRKASNTIINIHGGVLPEYKGNQCIFFALHEKNFDKIGSTLHLVTEVLDGGSVISVVKPEIVAGDNDETLYAKSTKLCIEELVRLLHLYEKGEKLIAKSQPINDKKTFSHRDRTPWVELKHTFDRWQGKHIPTN
ncbi:MAG: formyltransferase family protein [Saprospiraceae bacterium]